MTYEYDGDDILSLVFDEDFGPYCGDSTTKGWLVVLNQGYGDTTTYPIERVPTADLESYQSRLIEQLAVCNHQLKVTKGVKTNE